MANGFDDVLYGQGTVQGDIPPHYIPPLPYQRQLKSENFWAMEAERLQGEVLQLAV